MAESKKEPTADALTLAELQGEKQKILAAQLDAARLGDKGIIEKLEGRLSQKDVEIQTLTDALAEAEELIGEQQKALSSGDDASEKVHVTHDGQKYQVVVPRFNLEGRPYDAADLKADKKAVARLVELESGVLQAVTPEPKAKK